MPEGKVESHESYGLVTVHRTNHGGGARLFGSHVNNSSSIEIRISEAEVEHDLSREWYFGKKGVCTIRVSEAQWAAMLSSFNNGTGTPCTIESIDGKRREPPPNKPREAEKVRTEFEDKCKTINRSIIGTSKRVDEILEKKSLTKADRQAIRNEIASMSREVGSNLPFVLESFQESTEKIITHAKAEIDGFMTSVVNSVGLKTIKENPSSVLGLFTGRKDDAS